MLLKLKKPDIHKANDLKAQGQEQQISSLCQYFLEYKTQSEFFIRSLTLQLAARELIDIVHSCELNVITNHEYANRNNMNMQQQTSNSNLNAKQLKRPPQMFKQFTFMPSNVQFDKKCFEKPITEKMKPEKLQKQQSVKTKINKNKKIKASTINQSKRQKNNNRGFKQNQINKQVQAKESQKQQNLLVGFSFQEKSSKQNNIIFRNINKITNKMRVIINIDSQLIKNSQIPGQILIQATVQQSIIEGYDLTRGNFLLFDTQSDPSAKNSQTQNLITIITQFKSKIDNCKQCQQWMSEVQQNDQSSMLKRQQKSQNDHLQQTIPKKQNYKSVQNEDSEQKKQRNLMITQKITTLEGKKTNYQESLLQEIRQYQAIFNKLRILMAQISFKTGKFRQAYGIYHQMRKSSNQEAERLIYWLCEIRCLAYFQDIRSQNFIQKHKVIPSRNQTIQKRRFSCFNENLIIRQIQSIVKSYGQEQYEIIIRLAIQLMQNGVLGKHYLSLASFLQGLFILTEYSQKFAFWFIQVLQKLLNYSFAKNFEYHSDSNGAIHNRFGDVIWEVFQVVQKNMQRFQDSIRNKQVSEVYKQLYFNLCARSVFIDLFQAYRSQHKEISTNLLVSRIIKSIWTLLSYELEQNNKEQNQFYLELDLKLWLAILNYRQAYDNEESYKQSDIAYKISLCGCKFELQLAHVIVQDKIRQSKHQLKQKQQPKTQQFNQQQYDLITPRVPTSSLNDSSQQIFQREAKQQGQLELVGQQNILSLLKIFNISKYREKDLQQRIRHKKAIFFTARLIRKSYVNQKDGDSKKTHSICVLPGFLLVKVLQCLLIYSLEDQDLLEQFIEWWKVIQIRDKYLEHRIKVHLSQASLQFDIFCQSLQKILSDSQLLACNNQKTNMAYALKSQSSINNNDLFVFKKQNKHQQNLQFPYSLLFMELYRKSYFDKYNRFAQRQISQSVCFKNQLSVYLSKLIDDFQQTASDLIERVCQSLHKLFKYYVEVIKKQQAHQFLHISLLLLNYLLKLNIKSNEASKERQQRQKKYNQSIVLHKDIYLREKKPTKDQIVRITKTSFENEIFQDLVNILLFSNIQFPFDTFAREVIVTVLTKTNGASLSSYQKLSNSIKHLFVRFIKYTIKLSMKPQTQSIFQMIKAKTANQRIQAETNKSSQLQLQRKCLKFRKLYQLLMMVYLQIKSQLTNYAQKNPNPNPNANVNSSTLEYKIKPIVDILQCINGLNLPSCQSLFQVIDILENSSITIILNKLYVVITYLNQLKSQILCKYHSTLKLQNDLNSSDTKIPPTINNLGLLLLINSQKQKLRQPWNNNKLMQLLMVQMEHPNALIQKIAILLFLYFICQQKQSRETNKKQQYKQFDESIKLLYFSKEITKRNLLVLRFGQRYLQQKLLAKLLVNQHQFKDQFKQGFKDVQKQLQNTVRQTFQKDLQDMNVRQVTNFDAKRSMFATKANNIEDLYQMQNFTRKSQQSHKIDIESLNKVEQQQQPLNLNLNLSNRKAEQVHRFYPIQQLNSEQEISQQDMIYQHLMNSSEKQQRIEEAITFKKQSDNQQRRQRNRTSSGIRTHDINQFKEALNFQNQMPNQKSRLVVKKPKQDHLDFNPGKNSSSQLSFNQEQYKHKNYREKLSQPVCQKQSSLVQYQKAQSLSKKKGVAKPNNSSKTIKPNQKQKQQNWYSKQLLVKLKSENKPTQYTIKVKDIQKIWKIMLNSIHKI